MKFEVYFYNTHIQVPRYELLKKLLSQLLKFYLTAGENSESGQKISLNEREKYLLHHISEFPRNTKDTITFIDKCGYSLKLWDEVSTRLYYTVLYCTVLYCIVYCTVLVLYCTVLYSVLYCTVLYCIVYCTALYCIV